MAGLKLKSANRAPRNDHDCFDIERLTSKIEFGLAASLQTSVLMLESIVFELIVFEHSVSRCSDSFSKK